MKLELPSSLSKLSGKSKSKKPAAPAKPVETGTAGDDVDYEWIPRSALRTPGSNRYACDNEIFMSRWNKSMKACYQTDQPHSKLLN